MPKLLRIGTAGMDDTAPGSEVLFHDGSHLARYASCLPRG